MSKIILFIDHSNIIDAYPSFNNAIKEWLKYYIAGNAVKGHLIPPPGVTIFRQGISA